MSIIFLKAPGIGGKHDKKGEREGGYRHHFHPVMFDKLFHIKGGEYRFLAIQYGGQKKKHFLSSFSALAERNKFVVLQRSGLFSFL
jgi:hypothetical protein